jgi:hypothetical protein
MSPDADQIIERVHNRLSDPKRWHGDAASRRGDFSNGGGLDREGQQVPACDPRAVRHCVIGAVKVEAGVPEGTWPLPGEAGRAFDRIASAAGWPKSDIYDGREVHTCRNDEAGYPAVLAAVERARR